MNPARSPLFVLAVDAILLVAAIAGPAVAYVAIGPGRTPEPIEIAAVPDLGFLISICGPIEDELQKHECFLDGLRPVLTTHGIPTAFTLLEQLTKADTWAFKNAHPLAHGLGQSAALLFTKDPLDALATCPFTLASGCFHGFLEGYLKGVRDFGPEDVPPICAWAEHRGSNPYFQCLHGLGHGLTIFLGHDWKLALTYCDMLPTGWVRESCSGGVFMENIISYGIASGAIRGDGAVHVHTDAAGVAHHGDLKPLDLLYPCNVVDEEDKAPCWTIQTSAFLILTQYNRQTAFGACLQTEERFIAPCFYSMGRDVSAIANWNAETILSICNEADARYREWCIMGAVKDVVNTQTRTDEALRVCLLADAAHKPLCYRGLGEIVVAIFPDPARRIAECGRVEEGYLEVCLRGANL